MGANTKRAVYGKNSTLVIFDKAMDAEKIVEEFGDVGLMAGTPPQAVTL
jgi:hypothetical protein